jgi:hypothetical protein
MSGKPVRPQSGRPASGKNSANQSFQSNSTKHKKGNPSQRSHQSNETMFGLDHEAEEIIKQLEQ